MAVGLAADGAAIGGHRQGVATLPDLLESVPWWASVAVVSALAVVVVVTSAVRVVPRHERLVVWRLGGVPAVRGPGLVLVLPGIDRWERVCLRLEPLEVWTRAATRDGIALRLKALALVSVTDPARHAARMARTLQSGTSAGSAAGAIVESLVRRYVAERDLNELTGLVGRSGVVPGSGQPGTGAGDVARWGLAECGLTVPVVQITEADVSLPSLHHWVVHSMAGPMPSGHGRP